MQKGFGENKVLHRDICFEVLKRHKGLSAWKSLVELTLWHLVS